MTSALFCQLARYNQWMNRKLYDAASVISDEQLHADKGAFFGSVFGTLNHLAVADTLWLKRFALHPAGFSSLVQMADHPQPTALDQPLRSSFAELLTLRATLDDIIIAFTLELRDEHLASALEYKSTKGVPSRKLLGDVLMHFFNHQTHHRGQATTLFSQMGMDVGATDLLLLMPNLPDPQP
ncbi:MAG TPA: DinB family protein [Aquabacterium sp.]|nr:DinB family protein [Aquabacterium sp.]